MKVLIRLLMPGLPPAASAAEATAAVPASAAALLQEGAVPSLLGDCTKLLARELYNSGPPPSTSSWHLLPDLSTLLMLARHSLGCVDCRALCRALS
jgi:hypothetical protein